MEWWRLHLGGREMGGARILLAGAVLWLGASCSWLSPRGAGRGGPVTVEDLRCEYRIDPLGIDVRAPRQSWRAVAADPEARGIRQTAYRILVGSSAEALAEDRGDLWDSGEVASDRSTHVAYGGKALGSGAECFWKVRVRDQEGALSGWSRPAHPGCCGGPRPPPRRRSGHIPGGSVPIPRWRSHRSGFPGQRPVTPPATG